MQETAPQPIHLYTRWLVEDKATSFWHTSMCGGSLPSLCSCADVHALDGLRLVFFCIALSEPLALTLKSQKAHYSPKDRSRPL